MAASKIKLLAIVGPTASGKTSLSLQIAKQLDSEIISADSRAQYCQMDIGTAKPADYERNAVPHWGVDIASPDKPISVSDFKDYACQKIKEIQARGRLPILVGGSGLYVNSVLYDYSFASPDSNLRSQLNSKTIDELQAIITERHLTMPENRNNKRYLIRAIEIGNQKTTKKQLPDNTIIIGLNPPLPELKKIIAKRINKMIKDGLYQEIKRLKLKYQAQTEPMKTNAYRVFGEYLDGNVTEAEAIEAAIRQDMLLVKKQLTWFKRNPDIVWFASKESAFEWLTNSIKGKI